MTTIEKITYRAGDMIYYKHENDPSRIIKICLSDEFNNIDGSMKHKLDNVGESLVVFEFNKGKKYTVICSYSNGTMWCNDFNNNIIKVESMTVIEKLTYKIGDHVKFKQDSIVRIIVGIYRYQNIVGIYRYQNIYRNGPNLKKFVLENPTERSCIFEWEKIINPANNPWALIYTYGSDKMYAWNTFNHNISKIT